LVAVDLIVDTPTLDQIMDSTLAVADSTLEAMDSTVTPTLD